MKKNKTFLLVSMITVLFLMLIIYGLTGTFAKQRYPFELHSARDENIVLFPYVEENSYTFFIPDGLEYEDLFLYSKKENVFCNDVKINNRQLASFALNEESGYSLGKTPIEICFLKTEGIPSLFVDTLKMNMDYVNSQKGNTVDAAVYEINTEGETSKISSNVSIKGRGNNSWDTDKKSYNLNFDEAVSLFGMHEANRWTLIPNSTDPTQIHNKVVYEFARETGLAWTPENEYVQVYFDGEYNGLYLLSEKIEVHEGRLELNEDEVLLKRELPIRLEKVNSGFLTDHDNVIEITYPENPSKSYKQKIERSVQDMEDAIFDLGSDDWKKVIDIDSWARCYLIDELFDNLDAGIASAYFYLKEDGKFYRGPVWDYDSIMTDTPYSMIADTYFRQPYSTNDYYYYLNQRPEFNKRVIEIYEDEFSGIVERFIDHKLDAISSDIVSARELDSVRWNYHFNQSDIFLFKDYLSKKSVFMKDYWENKDTYCKILVQSEIFYKTYMVEKGHTAREAIDLDTSLFENNDYYYADGGQLFSLDDVISEDVRLNLAEEESETVSSPSLLSRFGILNLAFLSLFTCMFICVIIRNIFKYYG